MKKVNNGIIKLEKNVRGDIMKKILFIVFLMVCVFLVVVAQIMHMILYFLRSPEDICIEE